MIIRKEYVLFESDGDVVSRFEFDDDGLHIYQHDDHVLVAFDSLDGFLRQLSAFVHEERAEREA